MSNRNSLKQVVVLRSTSNRDSFDGYPETVYGKETKRKKRRKKKKQSSLLSPFEKSVRNLAKKQVKASKSYLDRHEGSNRKKKNGWIRDWNKNVSKSLSKLGGVYSLYKIY